MPFTEMPWSYL